MKQHKHYLIAIAFIFSVQIFLVSIYTLSADGSAVQKKQIDILERKNISLNAEVASLSQVKNRSFASVSESFLNLKKTDKQLNMESFYLTQLDQFKKKKNKSAALEVIAKIQSTSANTDKVAQSEFEKINLICDEKLESDCLAEMDTMISQFPDSNWTVRSLLLLSHFYYKQNRIVEAKSLLQIIRSEFKSYSELNKDISNLTKQRF